MTRAQLRSFRRTKNRFIRWLEPQPIGPILLPLLRSAGFILKSLVELILGVTGLSLFLLLTPIALPIALVLGKQDDRHRLAVARSFPCLTCGKPLGERSIELADAAYAQLIANRNEKTVYHYPRSKRPDRPPGRLGRWIRRYVHIEGPLEPWEPQDPYLGSKINYGPRTIDAICPHCTQPHRYDPPTRQFVLDPINPIDQSNRSDSPKPSPSH
jgi:hypothetical protein